MPQDSRTKPGATASPPHCARRSSVLCTPPKLVAAAHSRLAPSSRRDGGLVGELAGQHAVGAQHLPRREVVRGVARPPGPAQPGDRGRGREQLHDRRGVGRLAGQPQVQGAHRPVPEPGLERPRGAAGAVAEALQPGVQAVVGHAHVPEEQVAVAGQRLGVAADRHVGAQRERPLAQRRRRRVVDGDQCAGRPGRGGHRGDVADVEQRVARGLQQHQPDAVEPAVGGEPPDLRRGHLGDLDAEPGQLLGTQQPGRVVAVGRQDHPVAAAGAGQHRRGQRGHPGGEGQAPAAVELADGGLEVAEAGLLGPRVGVGAPRPGRLVAEVERGGEHR